MNSTLYLTRNGLLEPLGQSQVIAYLRGLSRDYQITLITYEKPEDWDDTARMAAAQQECEQLGIRWLPQRFMPKPKIIAPALSMLRMVWLLWREAHHGNANLIHARSYIPAAVALIAHRLTGVPFIFDMRALWPEELITAGRLKRGSLLHRAMTAAERACLGKAAGVVSLTHAAVEHLKQQYPRELAGQRLEVIPTCADLDRFTPGKPDMREARIHGCIGTVLSGWFRIDWLASWIKVAASRDKQAFFEIVTRDDPIKVREFLDPEGDLGARLVIGPRSSNEMPDAIREHDMSVMFFTSGLSKLGSAPTRMAEVLGSGLPVVANAGVGDVARILQEHRVGVLLEGPAVDQVESALDSLEALLGDPELPTRCRQAAEALFSLEAGTAAYRSLYADVLIGSQS